jgi:uncharacterized protein (TIGR02594 family)
VSLADLYGNATSVLGASESGPGAAALRDYLTTGGQNLDPATTAWCAAYVNATLAKSGLQGTGKLNARSYLDWGQPVEQPRPGDVAVFSRGDPNGWQGHVGFFQGFGPDGKVQVLGGNQGDAVSVAGYDPSTLLGFRRAPELTFGDSGQPGAGMPPPATLSGLPTDESLAALYAPPPVQQRGPDPAQAREADARKRRVALFDTLVPGA